MERRDIPNLFTEEYYSALALYNRFRLFGPVFSGGWAEWPAFVVDIIEAFESASRAIQEAEAKKHGGNRRA